MLFRKLLFGVGVLLVLANPAAASLKRVIVKERPEVGFPPLIKSLDQQRLRLAQLRRPFMDKPRGNELPNE